MRRIALLLVVGSLSLGSAGCCEWDNSCPTAPTPVPGDTQVAGTSVLSVTPIAQATEVWCWAATAEMVFRHYGIPSINPVGGYQCGIVAAYFGGPCAYDCGLCVSTIGGMAELNRLMIQYGPFATSLGFPSRTLSTRLEFRALSMSEVATEIDAGRPIVAGITAGGFPFPNISQHVVVIVGYDATGPEPFLLVNDPFPYNLFLAQGGSNPYFAVGATEVRPGRYRIRYADYIGYMAWANTIYRIQPR